MASPAHRIVVDNSNLGELKTTCDEAVQRILSRQPQDTCTSTAIPNTHAFSRFKPNHLHADLRLALGFTASTIMIATSMWAYVVETEWSRNKNACAISVIVYMVLSCVQWLDSYLHANTIFSGTRRMVSKRIETEHLTIVSASLPKAMRKEGAVGGDGRQVLVPPVYALEFVYMCTRNRGRLVLARKSGVLRLGHLGEWFTEHGEFCEHIFEKRLVSGLAKALGQ